MKGYDNKYGDDKLCACGHPYYRHFDWMDGNAPVGCKYCACHKFAPADPTDGLPSGEDHYPCEHCRVLVEENKSLKRTITNLQKAAEAASRYNARQSRYSLDYLPYEEDDRL